MFTGCLQNERRIISCNATHKVRRDLNNKINNLQYTPSVHRQLSCTHLIAEWSITYACSHRLADGHIYILDHNYAEVKCQVVRTWRSDEATSVSRHPPCRRGVSFRADEQVLLSHSSRSSTYCYTSKPAGDRPALARINIVRVPRDKKDEISSVFQLHGSRH